MTTHEIEEGGGADMWISYTTLACGEPVGLDDPLPGSMDREIAGNQEVLGSRKKQLSPTLDEGIPEWERGSKAGLYTTGRYVEQVPTGGADPPVPRVPVKGYWELLTI